MAGHSGRIGDDRLAVQNRGSRFVSRDCTKITDQDIQLCNRIGCSGRLSSARSTQNLILDKTKVLKPPSSRCSVSGKVMNVNPSTVGAKGTNSAKPFRRLQNNSLSETASGSSKGDTRSDDQEVEVAAIDLTDSLSGESISMEIGSASEGPDVKPKRTFLKKPASVAGSNLSRLRISEESKSAPQLSRPNVSTTRPGSRYLSCSSVPAVAASDSTSSSRKQLLRKRSSEEESSSSSRAKQPTIAENTRTPSLRNGITISEAIQTKRSSTSLMDGANALVRARRSYPSTSRRPPQMPCSFSATGRPLKVHNSFRPNTTENPLSRNFTSPSEGASSTSLIDQEGFRHYNINGILEVFLAFDQIEHGQEISIEQIIALESNLFLNSLNFHDQHRDMRLDIDGMSYEELLALEERIGTVSTALSQEALANSINKFTYKHKSLGSSSTDRNENEDDNKCSICHEEYDTGDEMGCLQCKHSYHVECIDQWLRQKNWCPICKSSAASSSL